MRPPADHVNAYFADQVRAFAADLDQRAADRFPAVLGQALSAYGIPRDGMTERERAFVDALLTGMLQIVGEVVGLAMRRSADLVADSLSRVRVSMAEE